MLRRTLSKGINPPTFQQGIKPRGKDFYDTRPSPRQSDVIFWKGRGIKGRFRWLLKLGIVIFGLGVILSAFLFFYNQTYGQKVYPGVEVGSLKLGGQDFLTSLDLIQAKVDQINEQGFTLSYQNKKATINPVISGSGGPELAYEILSFDPNKMANEAFEVGRDKKLLANLEKQVQSLILGAPIKVAYEIDQEEFKKILTANFSASATPAEDAKLSFNKTGAIEVILEKEGQVFDYEAIMQEVVGQIENLSFKEINLDLVPDYPQIKKVATNQAVSLVETIIKNAPYNLKFGDKNYEVIGENLKKWLAFKKTGEKIGLETTGPDLNSFLENIAKEINIEAKEGKFEMKNGRVAEFQINQPGRTLDLAATTIKLNEGIINQKTKEIELVVKEILPTVVTENINSLGINELVGRGQTNFKGSPKNRRHNIAVGANTLHGILIKPGETFSLLKALGEISAKTGYLSELVIKGNKTTPEFGGGLCQIGTTSFRVALGAGLPITERQNHSYRVSYYEPPVGMDATIYDPKPDFRFTNDYQGYLLLQTRIEGDNLIFELYGTKDGRKVETSKPKIYNITSPPAAKTIETEDLKPGEKKCTEKAHKGADAEFTYTITYANGEVKAKVFKSHYKAWQEVCLVGKEKTD